MVYEQHETYYRAGKGKMYTQPNFLKLMRNLAIKTQF